MQNNTPTPEPNQSREWSVFGFINARLKRSFVIGVLAISLSGNVYQYYNDNRKEDIYRKVFIKMIEQQWETKRNIDTTLLKH